MIYKLFYIDLTPGEMFKSEIKYYLSLMKCKLVNSMFAVVIRHR